MSIFCMVREWSALRWARILCDRHPRGRVHWRASFIPVTTLHFLPGISEEGVSEVIVTGVLVVGLDGFLLGFGVTSSMITVCIITSLSERKSKLLYKTICGGGGQVDIV